MNNNHQTQRLFDQDAYTSRFSAEVIACTPSSDGKFDIVLDRTAFFPEAGGQCCDTGVLNGLPVLSVTQVGGIIHHFTEAPLPVGTAVDGQLEWAARFRNMQTHTGEHILSATVLKLFGLHNVGFHLGQNDTTVDFSGVLERPELNRIEDTVNDIIWQDHPVMCSYPSKEELSSLDYRSKLEFDEQTDVRIVEIGRGGCVDICACCAPHVKSTGEIGCLKILDYEHYKGGIRLHLKCGTEAMKDYRERYEQALRISGEYSVRQNELGLALERLEAKIRQLQDELHRKNEQAFERALASVEKTDGSLCVFLDEASGAQLRQFANSALPLCGNICAVLAPHPGQQDAYDFVIASAKTDLKQAANAMCKNLNGRGGGSPGMIQGVFCATREEIRAYLLSRY